MGEVWTDLLDDLLHALRPRAGERWDVGREQYAARSERIVRGLYQGETPVKELARQERLTTSSLYAVRSEACIAIFASEHHPKYRVHPPETRRKPSFHSALACKGVWARWFLPDEIKERL
jgi:hypothetical protein